MTFTGVDSGNHDQITAKIANIEAQLTARGWMLEETLIENGSSDDCHLVCTGPDGERRAWGAA